MTIRAALESLAVKHDRMTRQHGFLGMTVGTRHRLVGALQRKVGLLLVIEIRRSPGRHRMTGRAIRGLSAPLKLTGVYVLVTADTVARGVMENNSARSASDYRTMAFQTPHGTMSPGERKLRSGMIEGRRLLPGPDIVTKLAALLGFCGRVSSMGILVAVDAGHRSEMIESGRGWETIHRRLVTFATSRGLVPPSQLKAGFLMARQGKRRRFETVQSMARFALVRMRRILELSRVRILMAIETALMGSLITGVFALRDVTFSTFHRGMFS